MKNPTTTRKYSLDNLYDWREVLKNLSCAIIQDDEMQVEDNFLDLLREAGIPNDKILMFNSAEDFLAKKNLVAEILFVISAEENVFSVLKKARQKLPTVPVILVTQVLKAPLIERSYEIGISDYLDIETLSAPALQKSLFFVLKNPVNKGCEAIKKQPKLREKYDVLFQNSLAAVLFTKPDGSILDCNEATVQMTGYSKEEILRYGRRLFIEHTDPQLHKYLEERKKNKNSKGELQIITKSGKRLTCLFSSSLFLGEDGEEYSSTIMFDITERKKVHFDLQASEQRFKALVQDGSDMIGVLDMDGNYTYVSPTSTSVIDMAPESLLGKNAFDFIHPEDVESIKAELLKITTAKRIRIPPFRFKDGKGKWQWVETIATNLLEEPSIEGIVINSRVVTQSIELEQHLSATLGKLQNVMDASLDMICTFDGDGTIVSISRASETILGYTPEEMEGKKYEKFLLPEDREITFVASENVKAGKKLTNLQNRYIAKDGRIVPLMWSAQYNGNLNKIICVARDVTEREKSDELIRAMNEELRVSNERYLYSIKATNETIWAYDVATEELSWSESIERNFGYSPENNKEHVSVWANRIHEGDRERVVNSFQNAKDVAENFWCEEYRFVKNDGEISHVLDRGYVIRDGQGKAIKIVGAMLDMTEMRKKSLEVEAKNRELSEISWIQSHIVRAPIARILGLVEILNLTKEEAAQKEALEYLMISARELDQVTRQIIQKSEQA